MNQHPPITGQKGSFARFTISQRLPAIIDRLVEQYQPKRKVVGRLLWLKNNLLHGKIDLYPSSAPDSKNWEQYIDPYLGHSWFEAPFYFVEAYFYRLILDSVDFFDNRIDPFKDQKLNDLLATKHQMVELWSRIENDFSDEYEKLLRELIQVSLWGNKADLSQLKINRNASNPDQNLLDDSVKVVKRLMKSVNRVDIILDNAGMELFTDLMHAIWLIRLNIARQIVLHTKAFPTFVSDATAEDINVILYELQDIGIYDFIERFNQYQKDKRIIVRTDEFWNSPLHFYQMPSDLHTNLAYSDLIVMKGDANYRRVFGDRAIPMHTPSIELTSYLPAKSFAIRILKSEIMVGLNSQKVEDLSERDPDWMVSGNYGIFQLLN